MKFKSLLTKIILFPYLFVFGSNISDQLSTILKEYNNKSLVPIIIEIKDNYDIENLKIQFIEENIPVKKRSSIIAKSMSEVSIKSQKPIIEIIKANPSDFNNLKTSWIINSIFVHASKNLIKQISQHPNVKKIDVQNTQSDIIDFFDIGSQNINSENSTEPGIEAINVRPLWDMGYTGKGVLVFNYDTGVWPEHNAFSERFFGNFYPMEQSWDGYFSEVPNGHVSNHGTHTLGTMAGLVSETNDTIGIAFGSYWIANDYVTSTVATLPPIIDMITSFEWALNPDGDYNTDYDVPDVINNSWRWYNEIDTFQCSGYVVELMNIIEAAGIANIFSAGNNGPNNDGVRSPQRINSNLVNTFCVGSVNANSSELPISSFSCRGPTQCPGEGSLSIYPEVVAPGESIRSAWGKDGFNSISGTSMASPHVSGVVMLLKEAFPYLSGQEILLAIYNTANDLGEVGEDNIFGMGMIDAFAAFNFLSISNEPVSPFNNDSEDLILKKITEIPNQISCETFFNPAIHVVNNTNNHIDSLIIYCRNYSNNLTDSTIVFADLAVGQSGIYNYGNIPTTLIGNIEIQFEIKNKSFIEEIDYHNNKRMVRFLQKPSYVMPFFENFESLDFDYKWHIQNNDYSRSWETIETYDNDEVNTSAYVNLYGYNPRAEQKDELIGPNIYIDSENSELSFNVAYQKYNNSSKQDTLQLFISTDCGSNFNYLVYEKGGSDLSTLDEITPNFIPGDATNWRNETVELENFYDENIMLKFVTTNLRGNNIFVDDILVYDPENVSLHDYSLPSISIYPNPSKDIFEIAVKNQNIEEIRIYNSLGKTIFEDKMIKSSSKYTLDLDSRQSGVYIMSININGQNFFYKLFKNN